MKSAGRPLKGESKRVRVSFTLAPKWKAWLDRKGKDWKVGSSEALDRILQQAHMLESLTPTSRLPIPQNALNALCEKYSVKKLSLFGSVLHGDATPSSDIDFLVQFESGQGVGMFHLVSFQRELSSLLGGVEVDVRTASELSPYFREAVLREAEEIYAS